MPTCNEKAFAQTVINTGESRKTIEHVINHYSMFIADTIRAGGFESVRVPHFGIFQAKLKEIQMRNWLQTLPKSTTSKGGKP